jgi:S1-C subfamily serine protease
VLRRADGTRELLPLEGRAAEAAAQAPPRRAQPQGGPLLRLSREVVDRALEDRPALERGFEPGRLDVEGRRLLKLARVEPGSLYDSLGLRAGDVLMQVDGEFVHDADNPLFEALRTRSRVTLTLMRRGIPKTIEVEIE